MATRLLLLFALVGVAAAQSCPSKVCTTGGAGNVDCCKYDYSASKTCSWPNTPVSYKLTGKCVEGGKTYAITSESNSKGPPGNATPCKCPTPLASQACPSQVCTTGGAGNVDCCKHDYKKDPRCSWPNTPVSYRLAGACTLNGQAYAVTTRSNSQGPPNASEPCRCNNPLPATKPVAPEQPAQPPSFRVVTGYDIPGKDIPSSDGKPFTRICTPSSGGYQGKYGYDAYGLMCRDTKGCVAAVTERSSSGCAYMKTAGGQSDMVASANWVVMSSALPAAKPCVYANHGEKCTSDPFTETPICCGGNKVSCTNGVCTSSYPSSG